MDCDEWLMSSLKRVTLENRYDQLFMYDVSSPIEGFDWTTDQSGLWVYGTFVNGRTELNLLELPEKLVNESLTAHRDFKILSGSLMPTRVSCIKTICNSTVAIGNAETNQVHIWARSTESSDLLVQQQVLSVHSSSSALSNFNRGVSGIDYSGEDSDFILTTQADSGQLTLLDVNTGLTVWQRTMRTSIHGACFHGSHNLFLVCHGVNGALSICDTRQPSSIDFDDSTCVQVNPIAFTSSQSSPKALTYGDNALKLYDTRALAKPTAIICFQTSKDVGIPTIKIGVIDSHQISISGHNEGVTVYDTITWNGEMTDVEPIFIHDGHEAEGGEGGGVGGGTKVLTHGWHSSCSRMLISTGSEGSLHAWQFHQIQQ